MVVEDSSKNMQVMELTEHKILKIEDINLLIELGNSRRVMAATA